METIEINVEEREQRGSAAGNRLRRGGKIPAVVYSRGSDATMVALDGQEYVKRMQGCGPTQLFKFKSANKALDGKLALVKDIDIEPLKSRVLHLDFLAVSAEQKVTVEVPIEIKGESAIVKSGDGVLNVSLRELRIECLPTEIPKSIAIDISALTIGDSIHVRDIALPAGAGLKEDLEAAVVSVSHKREIVEEKPAEVVPAEGEAAAAAVAGAEGAAPEAGADAAAKPEKGEKSEKAQKGKDKG